MRSLVPFALALGAASLVASFGGAAPSVAFADPDVASRDLVLGPGGGAGELGAAASPVVTVGRAKRPRKLAPLKVLRTTPRGGARFVDLAVRPTLRFNVAVDPASITPANIGFHPLLTTGEEVSWSPSFDDAGRRVVLNPVKALDPGRDYEIVVKTGVQRSDGAFLVRQRKAIFYTDNRFSPYLVLRPDQFSDVADTMVEPRGGHTATRVGSEVLLAGGYSTQTTLAISAELFDGSTRRFRSSGSLLREGRAYHETITVGNGSALLIGGFGVAGALASTEFFDRNLSAFSVGPALAEARDFHAACALKNGRILVSGGVHYDAQGRATYSDTAEILDISTFKFRTLASRPLLRRAGHTMTLLPDGKILIVGGVGPLSGFSNAAEVFNPTTESFSFVASPPREYRQSHTATAIDDGAHVLFADGGDAILEVYDPPTDRFYPAGGSSFANRTRSTATQLPSGDVLFTGGFEQRGRETIILQSMDVYLRSSGDWGRVVPAGVIFQVPRAGHTATSLDDGRVLFCGGFGQPDSLDTAVIFTPDPVDPLPAKSADAGR
ncbi:MAG: Ig-like domain-containing protein [Planctomycetes bacterium]|nr:Ig-like domain-containing protein [Planctomycetota bacterium]